MTKLLITGAAGWLGSRLTKAAAGNVPELGEWVPACSEVRGLVLPQQKAPGVDSRAGVHFVHGDITQPESLSDFFESSEGSVLIHCAGIIHPRRTRQFDTINHLGTRHLLAAARAAGVRRVVHVSSNSPLGCNQSAEDPFDEESPYRPYGHYGLSKMRAELAVREAGQSGELETVIVRAPWFYGPNQPERQTTFFQMIRDGKAPLCGDGSALRSMAYVDNLCQGLLLSATHPAAAGETYWIADAKPYRFREILDAVERVLERDFQIAVNGGRLRLPSWTSQVAEWADRCLQAIGGYHAKIHVLGEVGKHIHCSIQKASERLGYHPRVSLEEGMRESIRDLQERGIQL